MSKNYWIVLIHDTTNNIMSLPPRGKFLFSFKTPALTQAYSHKRAGMEPHVARIDAEDFLDFVLNKGALDN